MRKDSIGAIFGVVFFFLSCSDAFAFGSRNLGHRMTGGGGEYHSHLPENSIAALEAATVKKGPDHEPVQFRRDFLYLEFDVRETFDHQLAVIHDKDLVRVISSKGKNQAAIQKLIQDPDVLKRHKKKKLSFSGLKVKYLTLKELQTLELKKKPGENIPSMKEVLDAAEKYGLRKPVAAEIKWIYSDEGRKRYFELLKDFRENYVSQAHFIYEPGYDLSPKGVTLFGFKSNLVRSFGEKGTQLYSFWCDSMSKYGFESFYFPFSHVKGFCK